MRTVWRAGDTTTEGDGLAVLLEQPRYGPQAMDGVNTMGWWRTFLDSLDSNGGHIFILVGLVVAGFGVLHFDGQNMKAGELVTGSFGALLMMLKSAGSNREQTGSTTTVAKVETVTPSSVTVTRSDVTA